jgi:hypothetical protein
MIVPGIIEARIRIIAARRTPTPQQLGIIFTDKAGAVIRTGMLDVEKRLGQRALSKNKSSTAHKR